MTFPMRSIIIVRGLEANGVTVINRLERGTAISYLARLPLLWLRYFTLTFDAVVTAPLCIGALPLAFLLAKMRLAKKPVIYDAFFSKYYTVCFEKKLVSPRSLRGKIYYLMERYTCLLVDRVFLDTHAHVAYFCELFNLDSDRFRRILAGVEDDVFSPRPRKARDKSCYTVLFTGGMAPAHGVEYIIQAAKLLEAQPIQFWVVGDGMLFNDIKALAKELEVKNVIFYGWVKYEKMPDLLAEADLCLGIFSTSEKSRRVLPIKAYQALAMAKPLITMDCPGSRELLQHGETAWLCAEANPAALAEAIEALRGDPALCQRLAQNGSALLTKEYSLKRVGADVRRALEELLIPSGRPTL